MHSLHTFIQSVQRCFFTISGPKGTFSQGTLSLKELGTRFTGEDEIFSLSKRLFKFDFARIATFPYHYYYQLIYQTHLLLSIILKQVMDSQQKVQNLNSSFKNFCKLAKAIFCCSLVSILRIKICSFFNSSSPMTPTKGTPNLLANFI